MGIFLNSLAPFEAYKATKAGTYFVDKSELIRELIPAFGTEERFYCITRPRRFGKSVMANMIGAFFGKAADSEELFHHLSILDTPQYTEHMNRHNVLFIDFSRMPRNCGDYHSYIGQVYVEFAYMTGVLPIAKYSSGSELNMFLEYDIATSERFSEYFGFLDSEVDTLYHIYQQKTKAPKVTREDIRLWYDGYHTAGGRQVYNPRSVVCALTNNQLRNYWTSSGPYDEIFYYIKDNVDEIRDDFVLMISGEHAEAKMQEYAATAKELNTKGQIYSAMVIYGLLTYEDGEVFIPNKELMEQFNQLLLSNESLGYVYRLARESERMLRATLNHDTETMAEILEFVHDTESPILSYNNETELSAAVNLVYLAARDKYRVEREDKAGKGYVDFVFYPERRNADAIILELKTDSTPEEAIRQIKNKNYALCFQGKFGKEPRYTGRILAVGISYDKKSKKHSCKIEVL